MAGIFSLFTGLSLLTRVLIIAGAVAAFAAGFATWRNSIYESGVRDTVAGIARNDKALVDRAWNARQKLRSCEDTGRAWDQTTGECQ